MGVAKQNMGVFKTVVNVTNPWCDCGFIYLINVLILGFSFNIHILFQLYSMIKKDIIYTSCSEAHTMSAYFITDEVD